MNHQNRNIFWQKYISLLITASFCENLTESISGLLKVPRMQNICSAYGGWVGVLDEIKTYSASKLKLELELKLSLEIIS